MGDQELFPTRPVVTGSFGGSSPNFVVPRRFLIQFVINI